MSMKSVIRGVLTALAVTFVFIFIMSLLLCYTTVDENIVNVGVYAGTAIGVVIGTVRTARAAQGKVLFHCLFAAVVYLAVMALATFLIKQRIVFNTHFFAVIAGVFACSVLGAVMGRTNV